MVFDQLRTVAAAAIGVALAVAAGAVLASLLPEASRFDAAARVLRLNPLTILRNA